MKIFFPPFKNPQHLSQSFGSRPDVYKRFGLRGHNGADYGCSTGTEVLAIMDGKVLEVTHQGAKVGYGLFVKIQHDGFQATYAHLKTNIVSPGDSVKAGDIIGISDNTGFSSGPHCHITIKQTGQDGNVLEVSNGYKGAIDPIKYFIPLILKNMAQEISNWAAEAQKNLVQKGITNGERPKDDITREEVWVMFDRMCNWVDNLFQRKK